MFFKIDHQSSHLKTLVFKTLVFKSSFLIMRKLPYTYQQSGRNTHSHKKPDESSKILQTHTEVPKVYTARTTICLQNVLCNCVSEFTISRSVKRPPLGTSHQANSSTPYQLLGYNYLKTHLNVKRSPAISQRDCPRYASANKYAGHVKCNTKTHTQGASDGQTRSEME